MESLAVYTNNPPCGAMRGFGANQAAFAIENLARSAGREGRHRRATTCATATFLEPGETFATGQILDKPFGLRKTLEAVKDAFKSAKYAGIACGIKNCRHRQRHARYRQSRRSTVLSPDEIHIHTGFTEMGQGLFTLCIQFAVEATGLPPEVFQKVSTDTTFLLDCGQTTASRGTVLAGNSIAEAGKQLKAELAAGKTLSDLVGQVFHRRVDLHVHDRSSATTSTSRAARRRTSATDLPRRSRFSMTMASSRK